MRSALWHNNKGARDLVKKHFITLEPGNVLCSADLAQAMWREDGRDYGGALYDGYCKKSLQYVLYLEVVNAICAPLAYNYMRYSDSMSR